MSSPLDDSEEIEEIESLNIRIKCLEKKLRRKKREVQMAKESLKHALSYLYSSSSSSESEDECEANSSQASPAHLPPTKKARLPVPEALLKDTRPVEVEEDPKQHEGRVRSFPHERGNWASYIFVPYTVTPHFVEIRNLLLSIVERFDMKIIDDPHVSLTKTFILYHHWIDSFIRGVQEGLKSKKAFPLLFDGVDVLVNEERTRTFLAFLTMTNFYLEDSVDLIRPALRDFKLYPFHEEGIFHVSFAWTLGDKKKELDQMLFELQECFDKWTGDLQRRYNETMVQNVDKICCKTGNKLYTFRLQSLN